jgi:hypothetical protein
VARKPQEPGGASSGGGASRENCGRQRRPTNSQGLLAGRAYHRLDWGVWHDRRVSRRKRRPVRHRPPLNHSTVGVEPEEPAGSDFWVSLSCYGATPDPELELVVASHCHLTRFRGLRTAARVGRVAVRAQVRRHGSRRTRRTSTNETRDETAARSACVEPTLLSEGRHADRRSYCSDQLIGVRRAC